MTEETEESESSPRPPAPIRARPWRGASSQPTRPRPYRLALRLIGIPAAAVAGVLIYSSLRDHFTLPECDSKRAISSLAQVLSEMRFEPVRWEPINTVSSSKDRVVCNALLPLPNGGHVAIDYTFYWHGGKASMQYKVSPRSS